MPRKAVYSAQLLSGSRPLLHYSMRVSFIQRLSFLYTTLKHFIGTVRYFSNGSIQVYLTLSKWSFFPTISVTFDVNTLTVYAKCNPVSQFDMWLYLVATLFPFFSQKRHKKSSCHFNNKVTLKIKKSFIFHEALLPSCWKWRKAT